MKRFLYSADVVACHGTQVFYVDAERQEDADARARKQDTDGIYQEEIEVTDCGRLVACGETTTDDCGDFLLVTDTAPEKRGSINTAGLRDRRAFDARSPNEDFALLEACADRIDELEAALALALGKEAS